MKARALYPRLFRSASFTFFSVTAACGGAPFDDPGSEDVVEASSALGAPSDPRFRDQWALRNTGQTLPVADDDPTLTGVAGVDIGLLGAWDVTQGSPSVVVAIIDQQDTDITHPDLVNNLFVNPGESGARAHNGIDDDRNGYVDDVSGFDFVDRDGFNTPNDHATHLAGIIAADVQNGQGITGVAPKVKFLPLRATANTATMVEAINYAKRMGAKIVNISQGGSAPEGYNNPALFNVMNANRDMLFVCSAGNRVSDPLKGNASYNYPSSFDLPNVVAVANIDGTGELAPGSFYGEVTVDLAAPGVGILSTLPGNGYGYERGTSMAAPHVAGVAALLLSKTPTMTVAQIVDRIFRTGMRTASLDRLVKTGTMLDARAALNDVSAINVAASSAPGRITLSWNAQPGATRYQVERDNTQIDNGTSTTFVHPNLVVDSPHFYRVRAMTNGAYGPWSFRTMKRASQESVTESFRCESPHPYPNNYQQDCVTPWRNAKRVRVHFTRIDTRVEDTVSYEILDYDQDRTVFYGGHPPDGFWTHWHGGTFEFSFSSDASGTGWGFAVDKMEYVATIPDVPNPPMLDTNEGGVVSFFFNATPGSTGISIYRSTAANGGYARLATVGADVGRFEDSAVTRNRTYYYRVSCLNDLGESAQSGFLKVLVQ